MVTKAVILACGLDLNFMPHSKSVSKEMMPILNRPVIDYYVQDLKDNGITDILFICDSHKKDVEDYYIRNIGIESELERLYQDKKLESVQSIYSDLNILFMYIQSFENPLIKAKSFIGENPFLLINPSEILWGESFAKQLIEIFEDVKTNVIPLRHIEVFNNKSHNIVDTQEDGYGLKITNILECSNLEDCPSDLCVISGGLFTSEIFDFLDNLENVSCNKINLTELYYNLIRNDKLYGCIALGEKIDINSPMGILKGNIIATLGDNRYRDELLNYLKEIIDE